jgi:hypothetical protein
MNYEELLKPYSEDGRTVEGQVRWLRRKGIKEDIIAHAIMDLYQGLSNGVTYENGHALDQALVLIAMQTQDEEEKAAVQRIQDRHEGVIQRAKVELDSEWGRMSKLQKIWQVIKGEA